MAAYSELTAKNAKVAKIIAAMLCVLCALCGAQPNRSVEYFRVLPDIWICRNGYNLQLITITAGCTASDADKLAASIAPAVSPSPAPFPMPLNTLLTSPVQIVISPATTPQPAEIIQKFDEKTCASVYENKSVAVEVDYRKYVDWFMAHNLNIRAYTPEEYVCGQ